MKCRVSGCLKGVLLGLLMVWGLGCDDTSEPVAGGGSETGSFGLSCVTDANCGDLSCLCGVCTVACEKTCPEDTTCTKRVQFSSSAPQCQSEAPQGVCLSACDGQNECAPGTRCQDSVCVSAAAAPPAAVPLPPGVGVSVRDFGAVGDGKTDDTEAFKMAFGAGASGSAHVVVVPSGTYLVKESLQREACCLKVWGEGAGKSVIRLQEGAPGFGDASAPRAMISMPRGGVSEVVGLGLEVGIKNQGAVGLDFATDGRGLIKDLSVRGEGVEGIRMAGDFSGGVMVWRVLVDGFGVGVNVSVPSAVVTVRDLNLRGQRERGLRVQESVVVGQNLASVNRVPVIQSVGQGSSVTWEGISCETPGVSEDASAVEHGAGGMLLMGLKSEGYAKAVSSGLGDLEGGAHDFWSAKDAFVAVDGPRFERRKATFRPGAMVAPLESSPVGEVSAWARVESGVEEQRKQEVLQGALDSGASVVYFDGVSSAWGIQTVQVPAGVTHLLGYGHRIETANPIGLIFEVSEEGEQPLVIEGFEQKVKVSHKSGREVSLRHGEYDYTGEPGAGSVELVDVRVVNDVGFGTSEALRSWSLSLDAPAPQLSHDGQRSWLAGVWSRSSGTVLGFGNGDVTVLGGLIVPEREFTSMDQASVMSMFEANAFLSYTLRAKTPLFRHPNQVTFGVPQDGGHQLKAEALAGEVHLQVQSK